MPNNHASNNTCKHHEHELKQKIIQHVIIKLRVLNTSKLHMRTRITTENNTYL